MGIREIQKPGREKASPPKMRSLSYSDIIIGLIILFNHSHEMRNLSASRNFLNLVLYPLTA